MSKNVWTRIVSVYLFFETVLAKVVAILEFNAQLNNSLRS